MTVQKNTSEFVSHEKQPRKYWGIVHGDEIKFQGTFNEVWAEFVHVYAARTLKSLDADGIRIARIG